jgi:hypothetical protein
VAPARTFRTDSIDLINNGEIPGGEGGIRTPGWVSPTLAFEASSFNRSDTSPLPIVMVTAKRGKQLPNLLFCNFRSLFNRLSTAANKRPPLLVLTFS